MFQYLSILTNRLKDVYPLDEARAIARWVVDEWRDQQLSEREVDRQLPSVVERLCRHEPVQQIFGHTFWNGLRLNVTKDTLIPRPETAELVEWIEDDAAKWANVSSCSPLKTTDEYKKNTLHVLDIGTGSGCIAVALAVHHPEWAVSALDKSDKALNVARKNADENKVSISFLKADILHDLDGEKFQYDIVVSNPPYICESERLSMDANVVDYEPSMALFVSDSDPLLFYRKIAELRLGRHLYFEINEAFGMQVVELLQHLGYKNVQLKNDIYGKPRFVYGALD
ncbi:MAG: peptide chain release factor N(5)-glutamine methyltransferase [Paludibacteraceae bacterium]|nr:peptide chain release factor N(5)-glutamine methyltransferase [Paludibacteraceae bacterium]